MGFGAWRHRALRTGETVMDENTFRRLRAEVALYENFRHTHLNGTGKQHKARIKQRLTNEIERRKQEIPQP